METAASSDGDLQHEGSAAEQLATHSILQALELSAVTQDAPDATPSGLQALELEEATQDAPGTPPAAGDGSEYLLSEPGGTDAANGDAPSENEDDAGPWTDDAWCTPLAFTEEQVTAAGAYRKDPVDIDVANSASLLTQRAVHATVNGVQLSWTRGLFTILMAGRIPLFHKDMERLLPNSWLNDEIINGMTTLM